MTDDEWEQKRQRVIMTVFQTGRPVFADTDGEMRYVDGDREELPDDVGVARAPLPRATPTIYGRAMRASRFAYVGSIVAGVTNAVVGFWHPLYYAFAVAALLSALVWRRVHHSQRKLYGARR